MAAMAQDGLEVVAFDTAQAWAAWLDTHHATSPGVWLRLVKVGSGSPSLTYAGALDVALCCGWIDGQKRADDEAHWLQRFTRRGPRSRWSAVNRERATALAAAGRMRPAGEAEMARARADGRWDSAYAGSAAATVPPDLAAALAASPGAAAAFAGLDSHNRYAILYRLGAAKQETTRARRLASFVAMLEAGGTIHPPARRRGGGGPDGAGAP